MKLQGFKSYLLFCLALLMLTVPAWAKDDGVFKVGAEPPSTLDPHFAASGIDITINEQIYQHLTYIDASNNPVPDLAASWESPDGKIWTFHLKEGMFFNNGKPVTAKDVVFSFNRLRDPKIGTPTVKLYAGITTVEAVDDATVRFTLKNTNPEFAADAGDYHACIIPEGTDKPAKTRIGSGPFMISSYFPEDRVVLKPNPYFKEKDSAGNAIPLIKKLVFIFSPDKGGQVEALRGGQINYLGGLNTEFAEIIKKDPATKVLTCDSNMHWVLHMRSDKGHVASDPRVRQALKLGTDHADIIKAIGPDTASPGNGFSPVGPAFKDYYLDLPPKSDISKAKKLLAEAGYEENLKITLIAQNNLNVIPIATIWKEQMAKIGVEVAIKVVPSDVYFGEGDDSWLKCDFGITDWGARSTPVTYFKLAYTSDGPWNESHWNDAEFDKLAHAVDQEMDHDKRGNALPQSPENPPPTGPCNCTLF